MSNTMYGLPEKIVFCKRCIMSNQRPSSIPEFLHKPDREGAQYLHLDEEGVCDACRYAEIKERIDWETREQELLELLDQYRSKDGSYDCLVPGSGGKDSAYAAHLLKYKYGMHPLTVTWPPILYTDYGYRNWKNWVEIGGFDNVVFKPNGRMHRLLTKLSIQNLLHPFQTFVLGQKNLAPKMAANFGLKLVFYGENEAEYGNPIADNTTAMRDRSYWVMKNLNELYLAGMPVPELMDKHDVTLGDLKAYLPAPAEVIEKADIDVRYLGYYIKWTPQEAFYYAEEHTGFQARPFRTEGTYSKYNSIDDKIDDLHYYTTHIKFGIGRTTYDASQEIRNHHVTREEGLALAKQFDGERPKRYLNEVLDYIELSEEKFDELCDRFRSPHLWKRENGEWKLRHASWEQDA
ncbi:MAG: N-acetyl sugar amidotransferase [Proteobacteria bacterium]|nr:N-acetyl sugar amidotransferase [Pseudomonadota bacterium]MBU1611672.1 N-acetyl sugar amidotransferase [Pseudomonadota bacterium]